MTSLYWWPTSRTPTRHPSCDRHTWVAAAAAGGGGGCLDLVFVCVMYALRFPDMESGSHVMGELDVEGANCSWDGGWRRGFSSGGEVEADGDADWRGGFKWLGG